MRQSGRGNWIVISLVVVAAVIFSVFLFSGESPSVASERFMEALAKGDAEALTDMSYFSPERPRDKVLSDWKKTLEISKYYRFAWITKSSSSPAPGRASVKMEFTRDADKGSAYSEGFSLDLVQKNGKWLVDVKSLSRELYPALPR